MPCTAFGALRVGVVVLIGIVIALHLLLLLLLLLYFCLRHALIESEGHCLLQRVMHCQNVLRLARSYRPKEKTNVEIKRTDLAKFWSTAIWFFKWDFLGLFFLFFSLQLTVNVQYKICQWLASNRGPLESEATAPPTEPQPLAYINLVLRMQNFFLKTLSSLSSADWSFTRGGCFPFDKLNHRGIGTTTTTTCSNVGECFFEEI